MSRKCCMHPLAGSRPICQRCCNQGPSGQGPGQPFHTDDLRPRRCWFVSPRPASVWRVRDASSQGWIAGLAQTCRCSGPRETALAASRGSVQETRSALWSRALGRARLPHQGKTTSEELISVETKIPLS